MHSSLLVCALLLLGGCETHSTVEASAPTPGSVVALHVQTCIDRTQTGGRNLAADATGYFIAALDSSQVFRVDPIAPYTLTCDVSNFLEGSAIKRWFAPGWGPTVAQVAAMVSDSRTGETVLIVRGNATVSSGGLYTIAADPYILRMAVDDAVRQMANWARGQPTAAASGIRAILEEGSS